MDNRNKKIESIYPLSFMQQGLLFHSLSSSSDKGLLLVESKIYGKINALLFEKAWNKVVQRHEVMRSTVHWEKLEKPLQIVHREKKVLFTFHDWRNKPFNEQIDDWKEIKKRCLISGVNLNVDPLLNVHLIQCQDEGYRLLWQVHHLLIDGWSSSIILKDFITYYEALCNENEANMESVPLHKSYLNWLKCKDIQPALDFWKESFGPFDKPSLFNEQNKPVSEAFNKHQIKLSTEITTGLKSIAREYHITPNTLFQGIWSLLLSKYFECEFVTFGTTVSGRSSSFPNIEMMAGMFMNVLPVTVSIENSLSALEIFKKIQIQQQEALKYEHHTINEITSWIDKPSGFKLFDSLFIFENFPWQDIESPHIKVEDFKSGLTSTFPMTIVLMQNNGAFQVTLTVDGHIIDKETTNWFLQNLQDSLKVLCSNSKITVEEILEKLGNSNYKVLTRGPEEKTVEINTNYVAPKTPVELQLIKIWETILGVYPIGTNNDFFDLGGKSMQALRLFSLMEKELGIKVSPTLLLKHRTINKLAESLFKKDSEPKWKYLVPIKAKGTKNPLFCVHAGGGHIFFYKPLSDFVGEDRPVYGVQAVGVANLDDILGDIEHMARAYIDEMRLVQPKGILNVLVYCYSTAIGVEMSSYLKEKNENINLIVIDTMAEKETYGSYLKMRVKGFMRRFNNSPIRAIEMMLKSRILRKDSKIQVGVSGAEQEMKLSQIRQALIKAHRKYEWKNIEDDIWLLLTNRKNSSFNDYVIQSWKGIVTKSVKVIYSSGVHETVFEMPEVEHTAKAVESCLIDNG